MASPQRLQRSTQSIPSRPSTTEPPKDQINPHNQKSLPTSAFYMSHPTISSGATRRQSPNHPHLTTTPFVRMTPMDSDHLAYNRPDTSPPGPPVSPQLRGMVVIDNKHINNNNNSDQRDGADSMASGLSEEDLGYLSAELERVATIVEMETGGEAAGEKGFWRWVRGVRCLGRGKVEDGFEGAS